MTNPSIKAVVFDLDGVYFEGGTEKFIKALEKQYGLSEEVIKEVYLKSQEMKGYKTGKLSGEEFWQWAIGTWEIHITQDEIIALLLAGYTENPKTVAFVKELRTKGIKTAICTNNFPERLLGLEKRFDFFKNFDVIVSSYEEKTLKPEPEIFQTMAKRLELEPSEILMSDDKESNVQALQTLGFQAFLYKGLDDFKGRLA